MSRAVDGVRLALTTLTVLPIRAGAIDRRAAGLAMALAPAVGLLLGGLCAAGGWLGLQYGLAPAVVAVLLAVLLALATRGLHMDGLADTVDALASYRDREAALAIMKAPDLGPLGATAIVGVLLAQVAAFDVLLQRRHWLLIVLGVTCGRVVITAFCRRGIPAARPDGLGALVAGSVAGPVALGWTVALLVGAGVAAPRVWTGLVAIVVALAAAHAVLAHVRRRLGGITGDVLGAGCELGSALALVLLSVR